MSMYFLQVHCGPPPLTQTIAPCPKTRAWEVVDRQCSIKGLLAHYKGVMDNF